ncbi:MAG: thermonuclease family protein [Sphingomicrobium sp.]
MTIAAALWVWQNPGWMAPPTLLSTGAERVNARFTRCGPGRGPACVADGDTFKLGTRKIRIASIDAPEVRPPRCTEEARLGEAATAALQKWLNRGPFTMRGWAHRPTDRFGRELMTVSRGASDVGVELVRAGLAKPYAGSKAEWCA